MTTSDDLRADPVRLSVDEARELAVAALRSLRLGEGEPERIAAHLLDAELRGDVGMARILLLAKSPNHGPYPPPRIVRETDTTALIDAGGRFGFVAAEEATRLAVEKALTHGVAAVGVNNHAYTGSLAYYLERAATRGVVAIATATLLARPGQARVAPYGAAAARISTNPLAIAVPTDGEPIVWDISTSAMSGGRVMYHLESGLELPEDTAIDPDGQPTRDPQAAWDGAIQTWGGHRGSGLAVMLQLLGPLCGIEPGSGDSSFLVVAISPGAFVSPAAFLHQAGVLAEEIRQTPAREGFDRVRVPFDRSQERRRQAEANGIAVAGRVFTALMALAAAEGSDHE